MYAIEQQIRVKLEFGAMTAPVEVSVPWKVLRYLDLHSERRFTADGSVVYRLHSPLEACLGQSIANAA